MQDSVCMTEFLFPCENRIVADFKSPCCGIPRFALLPPSAGRNGFLRFSVKVLRSSENRHMQFQHSDIFRLPLFLSAIP